MVALPLGGTRIRADAQDIGFELSDVHYHLVALAAAVTGLLLGELGDDTGGCSPIAWPTT